MSDLIDREELIQELQMMKYIGYAGDSISKLQNNEIDRCIEAVREAPAAEARQKIVVIPPEMVKALADTLMEVIKGIDWNSLIDKMADMKKEADDDTASCEV